MPIQMPMSTGGPVQAVKPLPGGINDAPIAYTGTSATSSAGVAATGTITFADNPTATDTITINGTSFEFVASGAIGNQINIAGSLVLTLDNMVTVLDGSTVAGVSLATYTEDGATILTITYDTLSRAGNTFTLAASSDTPSGATLTGGINTGAAGEALYIMATTLCHVRFDGQAATVNDAPLPANTPMVFSVNVGDRVSVIQNASGGNLYVHDVEKL